MNSIADKVKAIVSLVSIQDNLKWVLLAIRCIPCPSVKLEVVA